MTVTTHYFSHALSHCQSSHHVIPPHHHNNIVLEQSVVITTVASPCIEHNSTPQINKLLHLLCGNYPIVCVICPFPPLCLSVCVPVSLCVCLCLCMWVGLCVCVSLYVCQSVWYQAFSKVWHLCRCHLTLGSLSFSC